MASAYADDLRRKLLEAHRRKEGSLAELAKRFSVSMGWTLKISANFTRTGKMERPLGRPRGPASKITKEIERDLKSWIEKQSDLTLAELQPEDRRGGPDFLGRKRDHYRDDPALGPHARRPTGSRCRTSRALANSDLAGGRFDVRLGGNHDGGSTH